MRRIDAIARTCQSIVAGKFNDRIPLRGSGDELDSLSVAINNMLDRIATLLDNLRQVSSDVAHDLRTPLTHLRSRLEEARQKSVTAEDYAAVVTQAIGDTDHLLAIFSALLRISQIESGSRLAAFAEVSLSDLLERIHEMYRPVAEDQHQSLLQDIEKNVRIRGDGELLTQMFSNLIENSIRHTPSGTRILIRLAASENIVTASIEDGGPGIPAAEHDKVFHRFYRLTSSRSTARQRSRPGVGRRDRRAAQREDRALRQSPGPEIPGVVRVSGDARADRLRAHVRLSQLAGRAICLRYDLRIEDSSPGKRFSSSEERTRLDRSTPRRSLTIKPASRSMR